MAEISPILLKSLNKQSISQLRTYDTTDKPVEITEGTKIDVWFKNGSGENKQTKLTTNRCLILCSFQFWKIAWRKLHSHAMSQYKLYARFKNFSMSLTGVLLWLITLFKFNPEVNFSGDQIAH